MLNRAVTCDNTPHRKVNRKGDAVQAVINDALSDSAVPIDEVRAHPENYNTHDLGKIAESLRVNGQYKRLIVDDATGYILAGNGTWAAARQLGWTHIAVDRVKVDEATARRILLVDNFSTTPGYDEQAVAAILSELGGDLSGTGITADDYASLMAKLDPPAKEEADASPALMQNYGYWIIVEALTEDQQAELIDRFDAEGLTCRPFTM